MVSFFKAPPGNVKIQDLTLRGSRECQEARPEGFICLTRKLTVRSPQTGMSVDEFVKLL